MIARTNMKIDRDEALRDDFHLESTYEYGEEDEWDEGDANWQGEGEGEAVPEEELSGQAKDESAAYLEFLNEEVWDGLHLPTVWTTLTVYRLRSLPALTQERTPRT